MIVGIDEVGRGCLAGPLAAGAVVLRRPIAGLADSKALTKAARTRLDKLIRGKARAVGVGWVSVAELNSLGLTAAVRLAMQRALEIVEASLAATSEASEVLDEIIIDGSYNFLAGDVRARTLVAADALIPAVSAASIVAKVARDRWMAEVAAREFPAYGFERHVGYGTALHREQLRVHGVSNLHRTSFRPVRELLANTQTTAASEQESLKKAHLLIGFVSE